MVFRQKSFGGLTLSGSAKITQMVKFVNIPFVHNRTKQILDYLQSQLSKIQKGKA